MTLARKLLAAAPAAAGAFDPLSYGTPYHAFWAEDPSWTNPGNGNAVSSWRNDGSNGTAATAPAGTNEPTFFSSYANLNSRPAITFDGATDYLKVAAADTVSKSQPITFSVALYVPDYTNDEYLFDGDGDRVLAGLKLSQWLIRSTSFRYSATTPTNGAHVVHFVPNDPASECKWVVDGGTSTVGLSPGPTAITGLIIGSGNRYASTVASASTFGFAAMHEGDITGQAWFAEYDAGLRTHYGV
jgi:hypothetical protein